MNRREMMPEPSMEDILASIRKIIADDPTGNTQALALPKVATAVSSDGLHAAPSPRAGSEPSSKVATSPSSGPQGSLSARLNDVFGPGVVAEPTPSPGQRTSARRVSIDDDLGDLLADGPGRPQAPAANPVIEPRPAPVVIAQAPPPARTLPIPSPAVSAFFAAGSQPPVAAPVTEPVSIQPSPAAPRATPARIEPSLMLPSFGPAPTPPARPAPVVIAAMPPAPAQPLPQPPVHVSPPVAPAPEAPIVAQAPSAGLARPAAPVFQPYVAALVEPKVAAPQALAPRAPDVREPVQPAPTPTNVADVAVTVEVAPKRTPRVEATLPPQSGPVIASVAPRDSLVETAPSVAAATFMPPAMQPANPASNPTQPTPLLDSSADAVASALGALAAGLAASARPSSPEIVVTAVEVKREATAGPGTPAASSTALTPSGSASVFTSPDTFVGGVALRPIEVRTIDDTAAELLRPMLRQWLDANMPRIVEKALRIELADPTATKPPSPPET